jgi:hypothetical protein
MYSDEIGPQQRGHYLLPILGALFQQDVLADALPDVPIECSEPRIHGSRHAFVGLLDQSPQVGQQRGWLLGGHD